MAQFRPLHDRVLVRRIEAEEKTAGGIIIPDTAKEKPHEGEVVAVGNGKVQEDGKVRDIPVKAGEVFYLPPGVPHSPQRMAGGIGLVIERKRRAGEKDGLLWYCEDCNHPLYSEYFELVDIENQFHAVFERFYRSREHRTCKACGHVNPAPAKYDAG
jgi:3-hydroxyanthranilate 3,4-dioxygenase